jgi:hypothetical protein
MATFWRKPQLVCPGSTLGGASKPLPGSGSFSSLTPCAFFMRCLLGAFFLGIFAEL